ncbi:hypothetical protein FJSC11DRAFT_0703 [Fischerella thermalis JSC-11]|uniref:Putative glycogen debranching enzyme N-terminal domain-containing protein n=1 Tax=Fischerella thermalis JSC-11 TaxID=741277 RepID=G6FPC3_9CYAN|nr:hypothetical protein [Fischerella thermalis]EHC18723.1 hypothetical protein FJSC11DRAFT_0703 [Fischerella thermalis JSC-11]PMB37092.1 hypothetical protein CEN42_02770 [Fischerella thermalis CCMEE 5208]
MAKFGDHASHEQFKPSSPQSQVKEIFWISVGSPILTINHGSTFMVTDLNGHIHHEGHQGIFCKVMWKLSSKVGSLGV